MTERERSTAACGVHEAPAEVAKYRDDTQLAEDLENGLKKAYADGSFMACFKNHPAIKAIFEQVRIAQRRRFDIPNPLLTEATRTIPAEYWEGQ